LEEINDMLVKNQRDLSSLSDSESKKLEPKEREALEVRKTDLDTEHKELLGKATKIVKERFGGHIDLANREQLQQELDSKSHNSDREWIEKRMMRDKLQVTQYAQNLEQTRTGNILLIHIPLAGGVFDVNTLGLWGGFTFAVILLVFRLSLWREYNNLKMTFNITKPDHLEYCYLSLAMQQVLTVPPPLAKRRQATREQSDKSPAIGRRLRLPPKPWGKATQLLYFPPVFIQTLIILNDQKTKPIGDIFSPTLTAISIWISVAFLLLMVLLTANCLRLSRAIDHLWRNAKLKLQPPEEHV
jgi:hypothetical protein